MQPSWFTFLILFVSAPLWTLLIYWLWNVWGGEEKKFFQRYVDILFPIYLLISIIISLVTIYWADVYWEAINSPIDSQTQMNFLTNFFSFWDIVKIWLISPQLIVPYRKHEISWKHWSTCDCGRHLTVNSKEYHHRLMTSRHWMLLLHSLLIEYLIRNWNLRKMIS